ncbi:MAG: hypothetical protein M0002_13360, partial [Rhodospirillales bacterium]|nr:hypothetical protein [Rhodospirillales bacterium]
PSAPEAPSDFRNLGLVQVPYPLPPQQKMQLGRLLQILDRAGGGAIEDLEETALICFSRAIALRMSEASS